MVKKVNLGKVTLLAPVLKTILESINKQERIYYVIPLFVAGPIQDFPETKELIVQLSKYPCQIVVIGMSDSDYHAQLEELNTGVLKDENNVACVRKMAQFISFADNSGNLSARILRTLPDLMCAHLERVSYKPGTQASMHSISQLAS